MNVVYNTLPDAEQGAADLERPAGEYRRPLAGMFRVRGVPGKSSSCVQHGCLLGLFGNSWGFLWDADDSSWESWGAILEPLGAHLGGSG